MKKEHGFTLTHDIYYLRFKELLLLLKDKGKIVVLIDEYDKPLIDHLTNIPLAIQMRDILKGFYSILKGNDEHMKFVLLTGVSKFSKAGVFSEMNHLDDITMDDKYSSMLGLTAKEIEKNFKEYINDFCEAKKISQEQLFNDMEHWYNGYCFSENGIKVFNPFSTLSAFNKKSFKNYWFETGTPTFLVTHIKEKQYPFFTIPVNVEESAFITYELENLAVTPLLFQTGYLTIKEIEKRRMLFTLDFPNYEVKKSFLSYLLNNFSNKETASSQIFTLIDALSADAVVVSNSIYVFEFKFGGTKEEALRQIKERKYYEPYLNSGKEIYLIGAVFENKNIGEWRVERMTNLCNMQ